MAAESKEGFEPIAAGSSVAIQELSSDEVGTDTAAEEQKSTTTEFKPATFAPWLTSDPASKEKLRQCVFDLDSKAIGQFLVDLFNSDALRSQMLVASKKAAPGALAGHVEAVQYHELSTTVTSMTFFDRLVEEGLVTETGYIRKCIDDVIEGCTVSDLFRELLVNPDSENAHIFDDDDREEFIFQLMRAVATGGSMCQYEDQWKPYLDAVKFTYKDMLKVYKNANTGKIQVASRVFRVTSLTGAALFPDDNEHNACFVAVDPSARTVTVWYSAFVPFW